MLGREALVEPTLNGLPDHLDMRGVCACSSKNATYELGVRSPTRSNALEAHGTDTGKVIRARPIPAEQGPGKESVERSALQTVVNGGSWPGPSPANVS